MLVASTGPTVGFSPDTFHLFMLITYKGSVKLDPKQSEEAIYRWTRLDLFDLKETEKVHIQLQISHLKKSLDCLQFEELHSFSKSHQMGIILRRI